MEPDFQSFAWRITRTAVEGFQKPLTVNQIPMEKKTCFDLLILVYQYQLFCQIGNEIVNIISY